MIEQG